MLTLLISLATLAFVVVQQLESRRQAKRLEENQLTALKRSLPPEEIDNMIAEVIDRLGYLSALGVAVGDFAHGLIDPGYKAK